MLVEICISLNVIPLDHADPDPRTQMNADPDQHHCIFYTHCAGGTSIGENLLYLINKRGQNLKTNILSAESRLCCKNCRIHVYSRIDGLQLHPRWNRKANQWKPSKNRISTSLSQSENGNCQKTIQPSESNSTSEKRKKYRLAVFSEIAET